MTTPIQSTMPGPHPILTSHQDLNNTVVGLYSLLLPQKTATGFPSQYTLQTFNNNVNEQANVMSNVSNMIQNQITQIHLACDHIKLETLEHYQQYHDQAQQQQQQQQQLEQSNVQLEEGELDEEQCLLRDIVLLHKEFDQGLKTIIPQYDRLVIAEQMIGQVISQHQDHKRDSTDNNDTVG